MESSNQMKKAASIDKKLLNGRYQMVGKIGRGAYGSVYKVEDTKYEAKDENNSSGHKFVAVK